ncbi:RnfH family protein [Arenicella sp. 4NH20-0111]|uniref:RnfH family protein n=1 Tax=Arenicella sp. 4NH20-0111 TaxID=3127648 RepID=UPI0031076B2A
MRHTISVSIVYAKREKQWLIEKNVPRGTSALDLFEESGLRDECADLNEIDPQKIQFGVYAQKIAPDHLLEEGDRVEIYRPLAADPKEVRRKLALMGKTMGKKVQL